MPLFQTVIIISTFKYYCQHEPEDNYPPLKAASLLQSDIIWLQYAKCNWIPQSGQCRTTNTHTHTKRCFLFASGDLPHYSAYHSPQGCDRQARLSKGQIYSVWINSSGLKSWFTPWLDFGFSPCLYTDLFLKPCVTACSLIHFQKLRQKEARLRSHNGKLALQQFLLVIITFYSPK